MVLYTRWRLNFSSILGQMGLETHTCGAIYKVEAKFQFDFGADGS